VVTHGDLVMKIEESETGEFWHPAPKALEDPAGFLVAWGRRSFVVVKAIAVLASLSHAVWSYTAHRRVTAGLIVDGTILVAIVAWAIWNMARNGSPRTRA
jgi:hypothetical protein